MEDFEKKSRAIHGDKYSYHLFEYKTAFTKGLLFCNEHQKPFLIKPNAHLSMGVGCPECAENGFNKHKSGYIYILKCEGIIKLGITNRKIKERIREINKESGKKFEEFYHIYFEKGIDAKDIETSSLGVLRSNFKGVAEQFNGYSECFIDVTVENVKEILLGEVQKYYKE